MVPVIAPTVKLNNGRQIPMLGLGTWLMESKDGVEFIKKAIDVGYRHFDTALIYHSEHIIGEAIREKIQDGTVTRDELFITTKLWCTFAYKDKVVDACKKSLKNLGLDYIDLYLIHWPLGFQAADESQGDLPNAIPDVETLLQTPYYFPRDSSGNILLTDNDYVDTWKGMEKCVELGLTRSIGVSNFNSQQMDRLVNNATIKPVTNQVECNLYLNQKKLIDFCRERDVLITCYGPLGAAVPPPKNPNMPRMLDHPTVVKIAQKKNKVPAQVALRYQIQRGAIVIPKTSNPKRLLENISVFDFSLSPDEMDELDGLNCNERIYEIPGTAHHKYYPFGIEF